MPKQIKVDGTETELLDTTLETLQAAVGGYIEGIYAVSGHRMYVNEEGLLKGLALNQKASFLAGQNIVGDAVLFTKKETETES